MEWLAELIESDHIVLEHALKLLVSLSAVRLELSGNGTTRAPGSELTA